MEAIEEALPRIRQNLNVYKLKEIYNMDETDPFWRLQADNSLATKQLKGRSQSKERITITICVIADGSDKLPLLRISCHQQNVVDAQHLCSLVEEEVFKRVHWRNIFLILDDCTARIPVEKLAEQSRVEEYYASLPPAKRTLENPAM